MGLEVVEPGRETGFPCLVEEFGEFRILRLANTRHRGKRDGVGGSVLRGCSGLIRRLGGRWLVGVLRGHQVQGPKLSDVGFDSVQPHVNAPRGESAKGDAYCNGGDNDLRIAAHGLTLANGVLPCAGTAGGSIAPPGLQSRLGSWLPYPHGNPAATD